MDEPDPVGTFFPAPGLMVVRTEKSVEISGTMELSGPEANPIRASQIQMSINAMWTKSFPDGSSVRCNIFVRYRGPESEPTKVAQIEAAKRLGPSHVNRWWPGRPMILNANESDAFTWTPAHELAHVLGMDDRYHEGLVSRISGELGGERTNTVDPKYRHNLLAVDQGVLESMNLTDLAEETAPGWPHRDAQLLEWLKGHSDADVARLSTATKIRAIKVLMTGWISDEDMAGISRICNSATSRAEVDAISGSIDPLEFTSLGQRTKFRIVMVKMKYRYSNTNSPPFTPLHAWSALPRVRVGHGETLSGIAGKHYRDEEYWPLIWDYNRGKIGPNPNRIQEGTVLELLPLSSMSSTQRNDAKRRHKIWKNVPHGSGPHPSGSSKHPDGGPKHPHGQPIKVAPLR